MNGALWVILKALFTILPVIVLGVHDGLIRNGTADEISNAVILASKKRADDAIAARDGPDDGMSDGMDRGGG